MKVLVDNVATLAIEVCLSSRLSELLSPTSILEMDAASITAIAAEPEESQIEREQLTRKLEVLQSGLDICKRYVGHSGIALFKDKAKDEGARTPTPVTPSANGDARTRSEAGSPFSKPSSTASPLPEDSVEQVEVAQPRLKSPFTGFGWGNEVAVETETEVIEDAPTPDVPVPVPVAEDEYFNATTSTKKSKKGKKSLASWY